MSEPNAECEAAVANSKNLTERPGNAKKKTGFGDMVGHAKWDA